VRPVRRNPGYLRGLRHDCSNGSASKRHSNVVGFVLGEENVNGAVAASRVVTVPAGRT